MLCILSGSLHVFSHGQEARGKGQTPNCCDFLELPVHTCTRATADPFPCCLHISCFMHSLGNTIVKTILLGKQQWKWVQGNFCLFLAGHCK